MKTYYEFFSGGGMVRAGLGPEWSCLLANDVDPKKAASYIANWGEESLRVEDVAALKAADLPGIAELAWASFPCQDLSLAGGGAGLGGRRSGTFWPFWRLMEALAKEGRAPAAIVLENVCGALTSHEGVDFAAIAEALVGGGYRLGALVIDAVRFLPQSRPRLFVIAIRADFPIALGLTLPEPDEAWHTSALLRARERLPATARDCWLWWRLPIPAARNTVLANLIEENPKGVKWNTAAETERLLGMMSPVNLAKVEGACETQGRMVGAVYKRTRKNADGQRSQRAEVRFDGVAGCLRTPMGGSSRQTILVVEGDKVRSRLLSPREAARLMGIPDDYELPDNYNQAYHLAGDGVAVPVVRHISENILEPLLRASLKAEAA